MDPCARGARRGGPGVDRDGSAASQSDSAIDRDAAAGRLPLDRHVPLPAAGPGNLRRRTTHDHPASGRYVPRYLRDREPSLRLASAGDDPERRGTLEPDEGHPRPGPRPPSAAPASSAGSRQTASKPSTATSTAWPISTCKGRSSSHSADGACRFIQSRGRRQWVRDEKSRPISPEMPRSLFC